MFVEVTPKKPTSPSGRRLEVVLKNGRRIRVPQAVDVEALNRIVAALEG
jgi:hypothetical protein